MIRFHLRLALLVVAIQIGTITDSTPCLAQPVGVPDDLSVSSDGSVILPADAFRVRIAFDATAKSATEAQSALEQKRKAIATALSAIDKTNTLVLLGVSLSGPSGDTAPLTTQGVSKAKGILSVEGSDLSKMSAVVDAALGAGATAIEEASSIVKSGAATRNEAIRNATEIARKKAESVAQAMGVSLGRVLNVSIIEEPQGKVLRLRRQAGDDMSAVGETVLILANVRYEVIHKP